MTFQLGYFFFKIRHFVSKTIGSLQPVSDKSNKYLNVYISAASVILTCLQTTHFESFFQIIPESNSDFLGSYKRPNRTIVLFSITIFYITVVFLWNSV